MRAGKLAGISDVLAAIENSAPPYHTGTVKLVGRGVKTPHYRISHDQAVRIAAIIKEKDGYHHAMAGRVADRLTRFSVDDLNVLFTYLHANFEHASIADLCAKYEELSND